MIRRTGARVQKPNGEDLQSLKIISWSAIESFVEKGFVGKKGKAFVTNSPSISVLPICSRRKLLSVIRSLLLPWPEGNLNQRSFFWVLDFQDACF